MKAGDFCAFVACVLGVTEFRVLDLWDSAFPDGVWRVFFAVFCASEWGDLVAGSRGASALFFACKCAAML